MGCVYSYVNIKCRLSRIKNFYTSKICTQKYNSPGEIILIKQKSYCQIRRLIPNYKITKYNTHPNENNDVYLKYLYGDLVKYRYDAIGNFDKTYELFKSHKNKNEEKKYINKICKITNTLILSDKQIHVNNSNNYTYL